jgi:hypothetical protein
LVTRVLGHDDGPVPGPFDVVAPTDAERARKLPGDDLVHADVQMDRAFDLPATPSDVWPWLVQLGKGRAGWYLPRSAERFVPPSRRAVRRLVPELQHLRVGETIPDWGGRRATLTLAAMDRDRYLLHTSRRGTVDVTWAVVLTPAGRGGTRVQSRVRLGPVRRRWLAEHAGGPLDLVTILGLAHGLRERLEEQAG